MVFQRRRFEHTNQRQVSWWYQFQIALFPWSCLNVAPGGNVKKRFYQNSVSKIRNFGLQMAGTIVSEFMLDAARNKVSFHCCKLILDYASLIIHCLALLCWVYSNQEASDWLSQVILGCKPSMTEVWSAEFSDASGINCCGLVVHQKNIPVNSGIRRWCWPCVALDLLPKSNLIPGYVDNQPVKVFRQDRIASHWCIEVCLKNTMLYWDS